MGPRAAVGSVLRRYATFDGRAGRPEHWWFALVQVLVLLVPGCLGWTAVLVAVVVGGDAGRGLAVVGGGALAVGCLLGAALLVPSLAVGVRRLHDTGRSGLWLLLVLAPYAWLPMLWFLVEDGQPGPNRFGPDPEGRVPAPTAYPAAPPGAASVLALASRRPLVPHLAVRRWLQPR